MAGYRVVLPESGTASPPWLAVGCFESRRKVRQGPKRIRLGNGRRGGHTPAHRSRQREDAVAVNDNEKWYYLAEVGNHV